MIKLGITRKEAAVWEMKRKGLLPQILSWR